MIQSLEQFVGQARARALLARYVQRDRLSGTFLLLGQRGLGKSTLATMIARALCCTGERSTERLDFCGDCYACRSIAGGEQPEYVTVRPQGQNITVKQLDEEHGGLQTALYHPNLLSHRVFLIDNAHYLNEESGNRLLKLFEEAPARTVFLLTTDRPELLLPTIHSRGQKITLTPLPAAELAEALAQRGMDAAEALEAAALSGGRFVDALALSGNKAWRHALKSLGRAISERRNVPEAAGDAAVFEHAMLWQKEQADHGMEEAALEKALPKARQNELTRQGLISAYDRASWWLLNSEARLESGNSNEQGARSRERGARSHPSSRTTDPSSAPHSSLLTPHSGSSRTSRVGDSAAGPRAGMSDRPAAGGAINMDDWQGGSQEQGARSREQGGRSHPSSRNTDPPSAPHSSLLTPHSPGPLHDPQYMAKLATLRRRISGNVDRELAQIAFEASL